MSHTHPEHGITPSVGHGTAAPLHFSEAEWQQYRDSDRAACKAVVLIEAVPLTTLPVPRKFAGATVPS